MKTYEELLAERDSLVSQLTDAFGDGYYDGFLDGAKHHEKTDCNTDPSYLGEDALRCSEIAEQAKSKRMGIPSRLDMLAERDALATQVVAMRISIISNCYDDPSTSGRRLMDLANRTPQQCLAEIKAEAYEAGFCKAKHVYKCELGYCSTDIHEWFDEWEANKFAAKVRQGGVE